MPAPLKGVITLHDGSDGLSSDYFINYSKFLFYYISCLFHCMITFSYGPTSKHISTTGSISPQIYLHNYVYNRHTT